MWSMEPLSLGRPCFVFSAQTPFRTRSQLCFWSLPDPLLQTGNAHRCHNRLVSSCLPLLCESQFLAQIRWMPANQPHRTPKPYLQATGFSIRTCNILGHPPQLGKQLWGPVHPCSLPILDSLLLASVFCEASRWEFWILNQWIPGKP